jgi:hypothetical protein
VAVRLGRLLIFSCLMAIDRLFSLCVCYPQQALGGEISLWDSLANAADRVKAGKIRFMSLLPFGV